MSLRALDGVDQCGRPGMLIAHVLFTAVAPIGFVKRDLVATRNALYFLFAHKDSNLGIRMLDGSRRF
jgi:hypothetical protein